MRNGGNGYTIIEVLIFLAISLLIFMAAMVSVGGQQAHTEFKTAYNDVNTKFQQWIDQVVNGYSGTTAGPIPSDLRCSKGLGGRPVLTPVPAGTGNERGANPECIFLGKAIQVTADVTPPISSQDPQKVYAYSVIGLRLNGTNDLSSSLTDAMPAPAVDTAIPPGPTDLVEEYTIPNGVRVKWVKSGPSLSNLSSTSHLAGFYTSFSNGSSAQAQNGSQSLIAVQYPMTQNRDPRSSAVIECIDLNFAKCGLASSPDPANPWPMGQWVVCLESTRNSDTAAIYISSTNGNGATTKVAVPCP